MQVIEMIFSQIEMTRIVFKLLQNKEVQLCEVQFQYISKTIKSFVLDMSIKYSNVVYLFVSLLQTILAIFIENERIHTSFRPL